LNPSQTIVEVTRGAIVESSHRGHIAVVDSKQQPIASAGDPSCLTFARSTAKLLQAIPLLEMEGDRLFQFDDSMIALICASHSGEDLHAGLVEAILHRIGSEESALRCGVHEPFHQPTAERLKAAGIPVTPLRNNCSGKHSGMLALSRLLEQQPGVPYTALSHPVQQRMLEVVTAMSGLPAERIALGVDGCGVPVFGMPLESLAYAYARLGRPEDLPEQRARACRKIISAIARQPYYVAGSDRFDTRLIEVTQGRIIGKMGAEGVFAICLPEQGWGAALKVEDGAPRALYPAAVETLHQLDMLRKDELIRLKDYHYTDITNCQKEIVGTIRPVLKLAAPR
jgi:L-asparaginase II